MNALTCWSAAQGATTKNYEASSRRGMILKSVYKFCKTSSQDLTKNLETLKRKDLICWISMRILGKVIIWKMEITIKVTEIIQIAHVTILSESHSLKSLLGGTSSHRFTISEIFRTTQMILSRVTHFLLEEIIMETEGRVDTFGHY